MELEKHGDVARARELYQKALDAQADVEAHPRNYIYSPTDHARLKANYLFGLANANVAAGDPAAARKQLEQCVAFRREWLKAVNRNSPRGYLAQAVLWLADVCWRLDDEKAMHDGFKEGIDLVNELVTRDGHYDFKADLAETYLMYADALYRLGKYNEARQYYEKCPALLAMALDKDPESLRYQGLAVRLRYGQGLAALHDMDVAAAAKYFAEALTSCEKHVGVDADSLPPQTALVLCLARAGKTADALKKADSLRPRLVKDPDQLVRLAGGYALCAAASDAAVDKKALTDKALTILRDVTKGGYKDVVNLKTHPDLASLADEPAFKEIVEKPR
jgi:tetratricopeptide (TPR) repeat protein